MVEHIDLEDVIDVTMNDLNNDQKKMIHANMESYMKLCLESFSKTQNGKSQL
jgi:hypothetical protein